MKPTSKQKFTKTFVDNLPFPESGQRLVWDLELTGFGLRVTSSKKTYIAQARIGGASGSSRRISLGEHGTVTLQEARKRARGELSAMLTGVDPVKEKKRVEAQSKTLRDIVLAYLEDRRDLKSSTRGDIKKHLEKSFSDWADRPATRITRDDCAKRFQALSDRSPAQANQAFRILRALFNYARGKYQHDGETVIQENPVGVLSDLKIWNTIQPRTGRIPDDKIGLAWNYLQTLRSAPDRTVISRTLADAVSFLMATGCRWSEMAELTWEQVDLEDRSWHLPDPKNRIPITFPLSDVAVGILKDRWQETGFVFPARSGSGHVTAAGGIMGDISSKIKIKVTPHDLRRTFRSIAGICKIEFWKTKLLMGHKLSGDVTLMHYTETADLRYLRPEIDRIGDWIVRQGATAAAENVVPFPVEAAQ